MVDARLFADHCVYELTVRLLEASGYDIVRLRDVLEPDTSDGDLWEKSRALGRTLLTIDLDFSNVLLYPPQASPGLVILRLNPANQDIVHTNLFEHLKSGAEFQDHPTVVSHTGVRVWPNPDRERPA